MRWGEKGGVYLREFLQPVLGYPAQRPQQELPHLRRLRDAPSTTYCRTDVNFLHPVSPVLLYPRNLKTAQQLPSTAVVGVPELKLAVKASDDDLVERAMRAEEVVESARIIDLLDDGQ